LATDRKIELEIVARLSQMEKDLAKLTKSTDKAAKDIENSFKKSFTAVKTVAAAAIAYIGSRAVISGFKAATDAASKQQDAVLALNTALQLSGQFSQKASDDLVKYADNLEKTTTFSGEAILETQALIQSLARLDSEGLKRATTAAADLAARLKIDLNTAGNLVAKAINGNVSVLAKYGIQMDAGKTKAENMAKVLTKIEGLFGGSAQAQVKTYSGAIAQLGNAIEDTVKFFGSLITDSPVVIEALNGIAKLINVFNGDLDDNKSSMKEFVESIVIVSFEHLPALISIVQITTIVVTGLVQAFNLLTAALIQLGKFLGSTVNVGLNVFKNGLQSIAIALDTVILLVLRLASVLPFIGDAAGKGADALSKRIDDIASDMKGFKDIEKSTTDSFGKSFDGMSKGLLSANINLEKFQESFVIGLEKGKSVSDGILASLNKLKGTKINLPALKATGAGADGEDPFSKRAKEEQEKEEKRIKDEEKRLKEAAKRATEEEQRAREENIKSIFQAFANAGQFLADTLSGRFIKEIQSSVELLGGFPKAFSQALTALPETIDKLTEKIPEVIDKLVAKAPALFSRIANFLPKFITVLIDAFGKIADIIAAQAPKLAGALLDGITRLVEAAPKIIDKLVQGLPKLFRVILQKLPALLNAISRAIPQILKSFGDILPELIVILIEEMPDIVQALVEGLIINAPGMMLALTEAFTKPENIQKIIVALIKAIPEMVIAWVSGIVNGLKGLLPGVFSSLGKSFSGSIKIPNPKLKIPESVQRLLDGSAMKEQFDKIIKKIKDALTFGGGGGDGTPDSLQSGGVFSTDTYGLASGGTVPQGFPNDTFPAMLSSGETVTPKDDVIRLRRFLDAAERGNSGAGIDINALASAIASAMSDRPMQVSVAIGQDQLAKAMFKTRTAGYRT
jgi:hypothetical protein